MKVRVSWRRPLVRWMGLPIFRCCHVPGHLDLDLLPMEEFDQEAHTVTALEGGIEDCLVASEGTAFDLNGIAGF